MEYESQNEAMIIVSSSCCSLHFSPGGNMDEPEIQINEFRILCKVCMQTFICTTSEVKCREHAEAKHPKSDVYACFPHLKK
nr:uncharacterized protein At2g23090-like [Quercus suber]